MFIYVDRNQAKLGVALVISISPTRVEDFETKYEGRAVEFNGEDLPHYITYEEATDSIREATIQERYDRGQYTPTSNQYVKNNLIKEIPPMDKKYIKGVFDIETEKWIETATPEEILADEKLQQEQEYRDKLPQTVFALEEENKNLKEMLDFVLLGGNPVV